MFGWFALVLGAVLQAQDGGAAPLPLEFASNNGLFRAQVHKAAGQERVADALARWRLSVFSSDPQSPPAPLWSVAFVHRPGARLHHCADDGQSIVTVESEYSATRALLRVWGPEGERFALGASDLALSVRRAADSASATWLAQERDAVLLEWHETPGGPAPFAQLALADGGERWVDLRTAQVRDSARFEAPIAVLPDAALAGVNVLAPPYVTSFECRASIHWGEVLELDVRGSHPTPNWRNVGFQFLLEGEDGRTLTVLPMSSPPPANSPQLQVLQGYHATARVHGLAPGAYTLRVRGRGDEQPPERQIEVLPARGLLELATSGGILGMDRRVRVYAGGIAVAESVRPARPKRIVVLEPGRVARIEDLLRGAERESSARGSNVSDAVRHDVRWRVAESSFERTLFEPGAGGALAELVRLLDTLHS